MSEWARRRYRRAGSSGCVTQGDDGSPAGRGRGARARAGRTRSPRPQGEPSVGCPSASLGDLPRLRAIALGEGPRSCRVPKLEAVMRPRGTTRAYGSCAPRRAMPWETRMPPSLVRSSQGPPPLGDAEPGRSRETWRHALARKGSPCVRSDAGKDGFLGPETGLLLVSYTEATCRINDLRRARSSRTTTPGCTSGPSGTASEVIGRRGHASDPSRARRAAICGRPPPPVEVASEPPTDPTPPVLEADDDADEIEIVETLAFDDADRRVPWLRRCRSRSPRPSSPRWRASRRLAPTIPSRCSSRCSRTSTRAAGADEATLATLGCLLGRTRLDASAPESHATLRAQALAWQGILRGESEDFAACGGGMLDEWSAALIAVRPRTKRARRRAQA